MHVDPKRYSSGKFIVSVPGLLKLCTIILFLASSIIFLATPICTGTAPWYPRLYPIAAATSGVLTAVLYTCFAMGLVKKGFQVWGYVDLIFNMVDFIAMLAISILTTAACDNTTHSAQQVPGPLGIIGSLLLATSSAVWFIKTRTTKEVVLSQERDIRPIHMHQYRKSVMV